VTRGTSARNGPFLGSATSRGNRPTHPQRPSRRRTRPVRSKLLAGAAIGATAVVATATPAFAQSLPEGVATQQVLDNLWIMIAGILVFFMQADFALVEAGLTRAKNVGNIVMKNLMDCSAGVLAFFLVGYAIAYG